MKNRVAMVVDADDKLRRLMLRLLEKLGVLPIGFSCAEDAVAWLGANRSPVLAVVDAALPGIGAFALCDRLRQMPATSDVPILYMCAQREMDDIARTHGADAIVEKPIVGDACLATARALIGR